MQASTPDYLQRKKKRIRNNNTNRKETKRETRNTAWGEGTRYPGRTTEQGFKPPWLVRAHGVIPVVPLAGIFLFYIFLPLDYEYRYYSSVMHNQ